MASEQVVVRVLRGTDVLDEALRRPVRLTPDGYAGVVYDGAVYPLLPDNQIDLTDTSWEPQDSNRFLMAGAAIPYAPHDRDEGPGAFAGFHGAWHVESNRFGHHVLFNSSERVAGDVVAALVAGGLAVQRWDVSYRPADDGRHYDWFARLRFQGAHDEAVALVTSIFAGPATQAISIPAPLPSETLQSRIEVLVDQVASLEARLVTAEQDTAGWRARLEKEIERSNRLDTLLSRSLEHHRTLAVEIAQLREQASATPADRALADREELLEFALAENAELEHRIRELHERGALDAAQIQTLNASLIDYAERLEELEERRRSRLQSTESVPLRGLLAWVTSSFPRLEFVLDSLQVLETFESARGLTRTLMAIDGGDVIGKDLEGHPGWREVSKIPTGIAGKEDLGRVYYRPGGQSVVVCIHVKQDHKEQSRFLRRLAAL